jgi:hypothetical protein
MSAVAARQTVGCEDGVTAAYEELRQEVLDRRAMRAPSHALALFVRQGMLTWMAAWAQCGAVRATGESERPRTDRAAVVADDAGAQVVRLLAEMVLGEARRGRG